VKHVILLSLEEEDDNMSGASEMPGLVVQTPPNSGWLLPPLLPNEETNASLKEEASKLESWSNYANLLVKVAPKWDDDTVSLGDDVSSLFRDYEGASGVQDLIQDDDGYAPHLITLSSTNLSHTACVLTKADIGSISKYLCTCPSIAACKCKKGRDQFPFWMLDSGSSSHFTPLKSDFTDYELLRSPQEVKTAAHTIYLVGKGTVFIDHIMVIKGKKVKKTLRIYPVYYLPHLTVRLLSLGTFLQQGLSIYGNTSRISLLANSKIEVLQCVPCKQGDTIYCLNSTSAHLQSIHSVFVEDYEIMHRWLEHLSKDILSHARDRTTGFPKSISFPKADPICSRCAKGKMPSKSFPTSESRATKPFEKIHSNLKSFSVVSYHKHKYYISFVDDYSSYSWIVCLCIKSSAIAVLKHFLAMIKNQFNTTIKEWMSDAEGEYKSNEFLNELKDNGIKVLQSAPHTPQ